MTIGDRIKQRRTELNMSQEELAQKIGYKDRSTISYIEKGDNKFPIAKMQAIADALKTTPQWLMGWDYDDPRESMLEEFFQNPDRRILFALNEKATDQQIKVAIQFMKTLLGENE